MSIRRVISILLLLFASLSVNAQQERYFAKNMILGSSYTWIWVNNLDPVATYLYDEYTWNTNLAVSLSKRVYLGLQLLNIRIIVKDEPSEKFNIYGLFAQYNMLRRTDHRFFIETSINRGNYCTCGDYEPFIKENLYYLQPVHRISVTFNGRCTLF